jgi:hypothetical protein
VHPLSTPNGCSNKAKSFLLPRKRFIKSKSFLLSRNTPTKLNASFSQGTKGFGFILSRNAPPKALGSFSQGMLHQRLWVPSQGTLSNKAKSFLAY